MKKVTAVLVGAGARGINAYASYALKHPHELQFVAVAEPNVERREKFKSLHNISTDMCFSSWEELFDKGKLADAALICTQDKMHFEPAMKAMENGYHVLLEKPMSTDPCECIKMGECARKYNRVFSICHVLRYAKFFTTIKRLLDEGRIGSVISIQHNENVGNIHYAHGYIRGNWRNSKESSPMILAKSCHDMDIMLWFAGADCNRISSFGSLTHFKRENAPEGAPERCIYGCPAEMECPYYAPGIYLTSNTGWPTNRICDDLSLEGRTKAMYEGPYGRCVYHCDNDVVDHQVCSIEFDNGVTAAFTMSAFTYDMSRSLKIMGTNGEIKGSMEKNEILVIDFTNKSRNTINLNETMNDGHGGGDYEMMYDFVRLLQNGAEHKALTSAEISVQSHIMAFAAEKARLENKVVNLKEYKTELLKSIL